MSIDDEVKEAKTRCIEHVPEKLYYWRLEPDDAYVLYGHCKRCKTDYSMPDNIISKLREEGRTQDVALMFSLLREAKYHG